MKIAFIIIVIHWIADFILQSYQQAKNKSKNFISLISHTITYSLFMGVGFVLLTLNNINFINIGLFISIGWVYVLYA
jgi:Na+/citrate or Na+/malate symporter